MYHREGVRTFFYNLYGVFKIFHKGIISMNSDTRDYDEAVLFDFGTLENMDDWLIVNDGVMGGLSKSRFI